MTGYTTSTLNYPQLANSPIRRVAAMRDPTANDKRNFVLGDEWLNDIAHKWWKLAALNNVTGALWIMSSGSGEGIATLTGNVGGSVTFDLLNNVNVVGAGTVKVTGTPLTNTLTITNMGSVADIFTEDTGSATPNAGNLNIFGGTGIATTGSGDTVTVAVSGAIATTYDENTGSASPSSGILNIVGGTGITTSGAGSTVTISATGEIPITFDEDTGSATPSGGILNIAGGTGISTSGSGSTVTITALSPTNLTFDENTGSATPSANVIHVVGTSTNGITTTGSGSTVTVAMNSPYADADFTFQDTVSGATRTLTTQSTSNTASSQAIIQVKTAGTSSGDPWFQTTIGGNRAYSIGPSNSFSGDLRINTNNSGSVSPTTGTNLWNMTPAGIRTMPLQPAFLAGITVQQSSVTGDSTAYTAQFPIVIYDRQSNFNSGTGVFTAPVTGVYLLCVNISANGITAAHTLGFVDIVTTAQTFRGSNLNWAAVKNSANGLQLPFSQVGNMSAGDTAHVNVQVIGGTKVINLLTSSSFSVSLLY